MSGRARERAEGCACWAGLSSEQRDGLAKLGMLDVISEYHPSEQPTPAELHELNEKKRRRKNELQNFAYDRDTREKWIVLDTAYKIDGVQFAIRARGIFPKKSLS